MGCVVVLVVVPCCAAVVLCCGCVVLWLCIHSNRFCSVSDRYCDAHKQALLLLVCAGFHYLIYLNTNHEVIKASSPVFCHIILFGGDCAVVMCGVSSLSNELQCRLVPTLTAIAFSTIFGALLAKTWRIHKIFNSEGLKIKTPTNNALLSITGMYFALLCFAVCAALHTLHCTALPQPQPQQFSIPSLTFSNVVSCVGVFCCGWQVVWCSLIC